MIKIDTRYIKACSQTEQAIIKRHIVYMLKKCGNYTKENVEIAMNSKVCDVY